MTREPFPEAALEFDAVRALVAERTRTQAGQRLARTLLPSPDPDLVAGRLALLREAMDLDEAGELPGLPALVEVEPFLERLAVEGVVLDGEALRALGAVAVAAAGLRGELRARREQIPLLWARVDAIPDLSSFVAALGGVFTAEGELADAASPALARQIESGTDLSAIHGEPGHRYSKPSPLSVNSTSPKALMCSRYQK